MKIILFSIVILGLLTSCSKFPDPSNDIVDGYYFYKSGSNQRALAGEFLEDSISIQIAGQSASVAGMRVEFSILLGDGELTSPITTIDGSGLAYTRWKLGTTGNTQLAKATIYDANGMLLSTVSFMAYAFHSNIWDTVTGQPDASMWALTADTNSNMTFMISGGQLYRQTDKYYNWETVNTTQNSGITSVSIDSKSTVYIIDYNGEVFKSKDSGNSWNKCNKPFPGISDYTYLFVSNNNYLWVSTGSNKLVCSKDEGYSWSDASTGLESGDGLGEIFQHPDGTLFFRTMNYRLFKSADDGKTWTRITTQDRADKLYMTANGDILLYTADNEHRLLRSTDKGEHFTELYSISTNTVISKLNFFNYFKGTYYLFVPGKGIVSTSDLIHFSTFWDNPQLFNVFVEHNGVIMASGFPARLFYKNNQ
jgi:photosystem II stability/assembly factor-like uncharacterized protein